jgi:hypothetical protein
MSFRNSIERFSLGMRCETELRAMRGAYLISDVTKTSLRWNATAPSLLDSSQPTMTDIHSVPQWSQGFGDLHSLIAETLRSPSPVAIRGLRQGIESYRPLFIQLLDDPPKSQEHRNTINSGQYTNLC